MVSIRLIKGAGLDFFISSSTCRAALICINNGLSVIREVLESLLNIVAFVTFLLFFSFLFLKFQDRRSDIELKIRVKSNF